MIKACRQFTPSPLNVIGSPEKISPLRITSDLVDSIRQKYPIEGAVLDLMLLDGRAVLVDDTNAGG